MTSSVAGVGRECNSAPPAVDRRDRQTDGRTDIGRTSDRYIEADAACGSPTYHMLRVILAVTK